MWSKRIKTGIRYAILILLLALALILLLHSIIKHPTVKGYLLARVSEAIGFQIEAKKLGFTFWEGLEVRAYGMTAETGPGDVILGVPEVRARFDWHKLAGGRLVPEKVFLTSPRIRISEDFLKRRILQEKGRLPEKEPGIRPGFLPSVFISGGSVVSEGVPYSLEGMSLEITHSREEKSGLWMELRGHLSKGGSKAYVVVTGTVSGKSKGNGGILGGMRIEVKDFPLAWLSRPGYLAVRGGMAQVRLLLDGSFRKGISIEGRAYAEGLDFSIIEENRVKDYRLPYVSLDLGGFYRKRLLHMSKLLVGGPDFSLSASYKGDFQDLSDPKTALRVASPLLKSGVFKRLFPTPFVPQWIKKRLAPAIESGELRLDEFGIQGRRSEISKIGDPEGKKALSLGISWREVRLGVDKNALPFDKISGSLSIREGDLRVKGVRGVFGDSSLREGTLKVEGIYGDMPLYEALVAGSFHVQDLLRQKETGLLPSSIKKMLGRVGPASGELDAKAHISYSKKLDYPVVVKGDFLFKDCTATQQALFFPVSLNELRLSIGGSKGAAFEAEGGWGDISFKSMGYVDKTWNGGEAEVQAEADLSEVTKGLHKGNFPSLDFGGFASSRFLVSWRGDRLWCTGKIGLNKGRIGTSLFGLELPGERDLIEFKVGFEAGKIVELKDCRIHLGGSTLNVSGSYNPQPGERLGIVLSADDLRLEDLGITAARKDIKAEGVISTRAEIELQPDRPFESEVSGWAKGRDIRLRAQKDTSLITEGDFDIEFSGNQAFVRRLDVCIGDSLFVAEGKLRGWDGLRGVLDVKSGYLNISDFLPQGPEKSLSPVNKPQGRLVSKTNIGIRLDVARGRYKGIDFGPARAQGVFSGGDFHIVDSHVVLEHGSIDLKGRLKRGRQEKKSLEAAFTLKNQPVDELYKGLGLGEMGVEGALDLQGKIRMRGASREGLLSSMEGWAGMRLREGKIRRSHIILKVLEFLSLQKMFHKRPDDLSEGGFYFESITGRGKIKNGSIRTEALIMKSPVFNSVAKGDIDLAKGLIDLHLGVRPLVSLDAVVSRIPFAGYILTGEDKSVLVYHFKIEGALSGPKVKYVPFKSLAPSLAGFFKRLFLESGKALMWPFTGESPEF